MNTPYLRNSHLISVDSGRRFAKSFTATTVESHEAIAGKKDVMALLASLFATWVTMGLVMALSIALATVL